MHFIIITPSFNQLDHLKRCVASVADQSLADSCELIAPRAQRPIIYGEAENSAEGMVHSSMEVDRETVAKNSPTTTTNHQPPTALTVHHHIQDGDSTDGTREYLAEHLANSKQLLAVRQMELGTGGDDETPHAESRKPNDGCPVSVDKAVSQQLPTSNYQLTFSSEADDGMYDALNRGIKLAIGAVSPELLANGQKLKAKKQVDECELLNDREKVLLSNGQQTTLNNPRDSVIAWLNCDEQYLPGTLEKVAEFFETHPEVDFIYGNTLLLDLDGTLLTYRKNPPLRKLYIQSDHLYTQSSSMFFRRRVFSGGLRFDTRWKAVSDCDFVLRLLDKGFRPGRMNDYLSVFTMTGENLSATSVGWDELARWRHNMPVMVRSMSWLLRGLRYLEKGCVGGYREHFPLDYSIYRTDHMKCRKMIRAESGTSRFVSWGRA